MTTTAFSSSSSTPKAPFFLADGLILLVALFIGWTGSSPLGAVEKTGITACLIFAAVITAAPFVIDYKRRKEPSAAAATPSAPSEPAAQASGETAAWTETFASLQSRIDTLEKNLASVLAAGIGGLRPLLDEQRAGESQARDALREDIRQAIASSRQTTIAHIETLLSAARTSSGDQQEAIRRSLEGMATSTRQELTATTERLLARLDEQLNAALSAWEIRMTETIHVRVAEELAEEKAAAVRRAVPAATPVLETSPAASPGKSRLGRGLESLISSPQAKPSIAESPIPQLFAPTPEPAAQEAVPESSRSDEAPASGSPITAVSENPTPPAKAKPVVSVLDPFHIPANGYADLAAAMDSAGR
ncbi:MAG TPA: hypothetical protein VL357_09385 [Rariglobus sp.]|jgi:hypothetical protein|nr:hypothetical protein [Rariglobus sp.]